jgi:hypothetical protein
MQICSHLIVQQSLRKLPLAPFIGGFRKRRDGGGPLQRKGAGTPKAPNFQCTDWPAPHPPPLTGAQAAPAASIPPPASAPHMTAAPSEDRLPSVAPSKATEKHPKPAVRAAKRRKSTLAPRIMSACCTASSLIISPHRRPPIAASALGSSSTVKSSTVIPNGVEEKDKPLDHVEQVWTIVSLTLGRTQWGSSNPFDAVMYSSQVLTCTVLLLYCPYHNRH